jgi:cytochrome P450
MALGPNLTTYNIFTAVDRHLHRTRRQLIGQVITERSMRVFEPKMIEQVDLFASQLLAASRSSRPVNMTEQTRLLGLNLAGLLGFGYDLGLQTNEENRFMLTVLDFGTFYSSLFFQYPLAKNIRYLNRVTFWKAPSPFLQFGGKYLALIEKMINTRTAEEKDAKHDLYSFVADALDVESGGGLRKSEFWAEANLFLTAGKYQLLPKVMLERHVLILVGNSRRHNENGSERHLLLPFKKPEMLPTAYPRDSLHLQQLR